MSGGRLVGTVVDGDCRVGVGSSGGIRGGRLVGTEVSVDGLVFLGLKVVFAAISLFNRRNERILSELVEACPPVQLPVTPCTLASNCSLKSPMRHTQSRAGTLDKTVCTSVNVSP